MMNSHDFFKKPDKMQRAHTIKMCPLIPVTEWIKIHKTPEKNDTYSTGQYSSSLLQQEHGTWFENKRLVKMTNKCIYS